MPAVDLSRIEALVATAKRKKTDQSTAMLQQQIDVDQAALDLEQSKHKSLNVEIESAQTSIGKIKNLRAEMLALREFMDSAAYKTAFNELELQLSELEGKLHGHQVLFEQMANDIRTRCNNLDQLRDRIKCIGDPYYTPKFMESRPLPVMLDECRETIRDGYTEASTLPTRLQELVGNYAAIVATIKISACLLRRIQEQATSINPSEDYILRRSFGIIGTQTRDFSTEYIGLLNRGYNTNWTLALSTARQELRQAMKGKTGSSLTPAAAKKLEPAVEPIADLEEKRLVDAIELCKLGDKMKGKRIAFYGGTDNEKPRTGLIEWLEGTLQLGRYKSFEGQHRDNSSEDRLQQSLRVGGCDFVVVFMHRTPASRTAVMRTAQNCQIPYVQVNSYSKFELCEQLAAVYKLPFKL